MKSCRIAHNAMSGVAVLIAASTMVSHSANAQCVPPTPPIFDTHDAILGASTPPNPCATQYGSGPEISREVVNSTIQTIVQSVRDGIHTASGTAVPGTAGLMRFTSEQKGDAVYQDAFGALAYAKEPLLTKAPAAPVAPSLIWGITAVGSGDSQRTSFFGGTGATPDSVANTAVAVGAVDVTKIGIFSAKDALNVMVLGSDAFTSVSGVRTDTPGVGTAITYLNGGVSADFIFNSGFSHTDGSSLNVTAYSYSADFNNRWDAPNNWWFESTFGTTYADAYQNGAVIGQVWTVQGGARFGTEFVLANGVKVQPVLTALAYSNVTESGSQFMVPNGANGNLIVSGDQGQLWGKGAAKFTFIFTPNFSAYIEGNVRGTTGDVTAIGYGGQLGLRWTW
jgi:hypothetical protein